MGKNKDIRWRQRFSNFQRAFSEMSATAALADGREHSRVEKKALIKDFELTHELAWLTLKDLLIYRGLADRSAGSKDVVRTAFSDGFIKNGDVWMDMVESRSKTVHLYDERTADGVCKDIAGPYLPEFAELEKFLSALED